MLDNLGCAAQGILNPVFAFPFAMVASVEPDMMKLRKLSCSTIDEQFYAIAVHDIGSMDFGFQDKALCVYQQVAVASCDFLACIRATRAR